MIGAVAVSLLMLSGAAFALLAGLGLVRMPDVYVRMHAATKAGTLGAGLVLAAVAVHFGDWAVILRVAAAIAFLLLTAPLAAHMLGRAAYRTGVPLWSQSVADEWNLQGVKRVEDGHDTVP